MSFAAGAGWTKDKLRQISILKRQRAKLLKEALQLARQIRILKFSGGNSIGEILLQIRKRKDREWVQIMLSEQALGKSMDEALENATRATYPALKNRSAVMDQAFSKLRQPDICQALESAFAVHGFSMDDAVKTHIGHITGTHTREVVTKMGDTIKVPIPPSYAALQGYYKMTVPAQTAKVEIAHTNVNDMLKTFDADEETQHRLVGEVIDVTPEDDPDEIDPFEDEEDLEDEDDE